MSGIWWGLSKANPSAEPNEIRANPCTRRGCLGFSPSPPASIDGRRNRHAARNSFTRLGHPSPVFPTSETRGRFLIRSSERLTRASCHAVTARQSCPHRSPPVPSSQRGSRSSLSATRSVWLETRAATKSSLQRSSEQAPRARGALQRAAKSQRRGMRRALSVHSAGSRCRARERRRSEGPACDLETSPASNDAARARDTRRVCGSDRACCSARARSRPSPRRLLQRRSNPSGQNLPPTSPPAATRRSRAGTSRCRAISARR
jgi:hypothetical protein